MPRSRFLVHRLHPPESVSTGVFSLRLVQNFAFPKQQVQPKLVAPVASEQVDLSVFEEDHQDLVIY